jgi:radical SAM protein with 4Fe4S-binding SPASM domain
MKHEKELLSTEQNVFLKINRGLDPYPVCIELYPTDICNQKCQYCFHGGKGFGRERYEEKFMQLNDYVVLFKEMSRLNINILSISGGGEPFLYKSILGVINEAIKNGLEVRIVTNGSLIGVKAIDLLIKCKEIRFSVDTPDSKTYSVIRKVSEQLYEKVLDNISKLVKVKEKSNSDLNIGASCIIGRNNVNQLTEFADLMLDSLKIDTVVFKYDVYDKFSADKKFQRVIADQLRTIKDKYGKKAEIRGKLPKFEIGLPCVMSYFKCAVDPYGQLYSCCLAAQPKEKDGYKLGNIKDNIRKGYNNPLATVWKESKNVRLSILKRTVCNSCNFTDRNINSNYMEWSLFNK